MSEWWEPQLIDDAFLARLRKDYPDRAILSDNELLFEFDYGDGRKYATTWDHIGDAYEQFEPLADAYRTQCTEHQVARALIWYVWNEFNAIRARDGAPEGVSYDFWNSMTEVMRKFLGDDAQPWPSRDAKALDLDSGTPKP